MATWDGSYPTETEDSSYFVYSGQNAPGAAAARNWSYYANNSVGNPAFLQEVSTGNYYPAEAGNQQMYEQSGAAAFYANILPMPSNMVPLGNAYAQEHILPSTAPMDSAQVPNGLQHSENSVRPSRNVQPFSRGNYNSKSRSNRTINNYMPMVEGHDSIQSTIVENSNLHPTANEFMPNDVKFKRDKFNKKHSPNDAAEGSFSVCTQEFRSTNQSNQSTMNASDNRYKGERRYDSRKNYKQKNLQDMQTAPRSSYKDTRNYNAKNYNKFQNDKYYNRKRQTDVSSVEQYGIGRAHTSTTKSTNLSAFNSQENRSFAEGLQEDNSVPSAKVSTSRGETSMRENSNSENYSSKVDAPQRNAKSKRYNDYANASNYYRHNWDSTQSEPVVRGARRYTGNTRSERYESNYKGRKNNFNIQNDPRGTSCSKNGKEKSNNNKMLLKEDNNEAATNYKEKKVENWRDRTENNETLARVQKRNLQKKYETGTDGYVLSLSLGCRCTKRI